MYIAKMRVRNWRNFTHAEVALSETTFLIGPNASGKSNLLDVFRFMRDVVKAHGGDSNKRWQPVEVCPR